MWTRVTERITQCNANVNATRQHCSRTAVVLQPHGIRAVSALHPRRSHAVSGQYPEGSRNLGKRNSPTRVQQNQDVGIALSIESGAATVRLLFGCCAATFRLRSGWSTAPFQLRSESLSAGCCVCRIGLTVRVTPKNANGRLVVSDISGARMRRRRTRRRGCSACSIGFPSSRSSLILWFSRSESKLHQGQVSRIAE